MAFKVSMAHLNVFCAVVVIRDVHCRCWHVYDTSATASHSSVPKRLRIRLCMFTLSVCAGLAAVAIAAAIPNYISSSTAYCSCLTNCDTVRMYTIDMCLLCASNSYSVKIWSDVYAISITYNLHLLYILQPSLRTYTTIICCGAIAC
jgi:hypothetical protein